MEACSLTIGLAVHKARFHQNFKMLRNGALRQRRMGHHILTATMLLLPQKMQYLLAHGVGKRGQLAASLFCGCGLSDHLIHY